MPLIKMVSAKDQETLTANPLTLMEVERLVQAMGLIKTIRRDSLETDYDCLKDTVRLLKELLMFCGE